MMFQAGYPTYLSPTFWKTTVNPSNEQEKYSTAPLHKERYHQPAAALVLVNGRFSSAKTTFYFR